MGEGSVQLSWAPGSRVVQKAKKKDPTEKQLFDFCTQLVDTGKVFFPIGEDGENDDGTPRNTFKGANKIVKSNMKYKRATGTGFDIEAVDDFFAGNPTSGISLIKFIGRDGKEWKGKPDEIGKIHHGFFGLTCFPTTLLQRSTSSPCQRGQRSSCASTWKRPGATRTTL